jgi:hypothetical protein
MSIHKRVDEIGYGAYCSRCVWTDHRPTREQRDRAAERHQLEHDNNLPQPSERTR